LAHWLVKSFMAKGGLKQR